MQNEENRDNDEIKNGRSEKVFLGILLSLVSVGFAAFSWQFFLFMLGMSYDSPHQTWGSTFLRVVFSSYYFGIILFPLYVGVSLIFNLSKKINSIVLKLFWVYLLLYLIPVILSLQSWLFD